MANEKAEKKDPVTNQPMSDFMPAVDDEHADAVKAQQDAIKASSNTGRHDAAAQLVEARDAAAEKADADDLTFLSVSEGNPLPERQYAMIPPDVYRAREQARISAEAATLRTNTIRPGGEFIVNGKRVDANGNAI